MLIKNEGTSLRIPIPDYYVRFSSFEKMDRYPYKDKMLYKWNNDIILQHREPLWLQRSDIIKDHWEGTFFCDVSSVSRENILDLMRIKGYTHQFSLTRYVAAEVINCIDQYGIDDYYLGWHNTMIPFVVERSDELFTLLKIRFADEIQPIVKLSK